MKYKMYFTLVVGVVLLALLVFGCKNKYANKNLNIKSSPKLEIKPKEKSQLENSRELLLIIHNDNRKEKNIKSLELDQELCDYAQKHAELMLKKNRLFHSKLEINRNLVGENVAYGQENENEVVSDWMNSFGHRQNILNKKYNKVGFGIATNGSRIYWCSVFSN